jgi:aryl-alcohol dehydrogenase-like predicted oxidoreductase
MSLTDYVTLGRSGLRVSPLCLGTMTFGEEWGWGCDVETSERLLATYLDRGGNFLDTANMYTKGHSETIIGDWFRKNPGRRDRTVLATKFMSAMRLGDPNSGGAGRKAIESACHESLRRLQTDVIDLYWLHFWDHHTPIEETMRALDDLVRAGKVRHVGFSDTPAWKVAQAQTMASFRDWSPLIALQIEYSLLERSVEDELIPMARELGLGVTPWSPLKGGILTGKYRRDSVPEGARYGEDSNHLNETTFGIVDALEEVSKQKDCSIAEVALAWCRQRPGVDSVIIGARKMEQLESNLKSADVSLSDEQIRALDEASRREPIFPHSFLPFARKIFHGGATINGEEAEPFDLAPQTDDERY